MSKTHTMQVNVTGKTLDVFCVSLHNGDIPESIASYAKSVFEELAPYIKNAQQVLYIRDIPFLTIAGKYPGGHCYNAYEAMISLVSWQDDPQQIKATINHELHHMARWQNVGYGNTLGGAILSEGIATYYEELRSGWLSPWATTSFSKKIVKAASEAWSDKNYNHSEWFFEGPLGKWAGYGIGYKLAKELFMDGFDLKRSVNIKPIDALNYMKHI